MPFLASQGHLHSLAYGPFQQSHHLTSASITTSPSFTLTPTTPRLPLLLIRTSVITQHHQIIQKNLSLKILILIVSAKSLLPYIYRFQRLECGHLWESLFCQPHLLNDIWQSTIFMDLGFLICQMGIVILRSKTNNDYRGLSKGPSSQSKCSIIATQNNTKNKDKTRRMLQMA